MNFLKKLQYPHLFLIIGFIMGYMLLMTNPPWNANDEDRHFYNAYNLSQGHLGPQTQNGKCGFVLPASLIQQVVSFQGIPYSDSMKLKADVTQGLADDPLNPEKSEFLETPSTKLPPFAYIPAALMIKIGGMIHSSPVWLNWWGRLGCLLAYLLITFYALKITPYFKPLLMMIALSPVALYQAGSVTYDGMCMAFLFLFFALLLAYYFQEQKITLKQILILVAVAFAQRLSKDGYFLLFFAIAFVPMHKFENKKVYFMAIAGMVVASFLPSFLWSSYLASQHLPPELALQKDYLFDMSTSLQYNLKNPMMTIHLVTANILAQGKDWLLGSIGKFGYSYVQLPSAMLWLYFLGMIVVSMSESFTPHFTRRFRIAILVLLLLNVLGIIALFYLSVTPVGGYFIQGLQGRYFTPLLPFILVFVFYLPKPLLIQPWLKWAVPAVSLVTLMYCLSFLKDYCYFS